MDENIEVLNEDFLQEEKKENIDEIIPLDRLFDSNEEVVDAYEEDLLKEELNQKKITKIQIGLLLFLAVFASLV